MGLKGKFLGNRSGAAIFGSKNKPEWKPIYASAQFDINSLQAGEYYDLDLEDNRLVRATKLAPMGGSNFQAPVGPSESSYQNPQHVSNVVPMAAPRETVPINGLMASATGIAKSLIENGEPYEFAATMALHWARLWGPAPAGVGTIPTVGQSSSSVASAQPQPQPIVAATQNADPNDDISF